VQATADLARALGAILVAEGVETDAQREAVVAAGCQLVQGWQVSRPLAADAVARLLAGPPSPRASTEARLRSLG
jgi:EAL domain-containing protein (putative c-di-GMP-specific phosphodiesterase class I)